MLTLRDFTIKDKPLLVEYLNQPNVVRFLSSRIPFPYTPQDAHWWVTQGSKSGFTRAININGTFIGCVSAEVGQFEFCQSAEIGYWLAEKYWRQGYATQALKLLIDELQECTNLTRLQATVFEGNVGSTYVLKHCGFSQQGYFPKAAYKNNQYYNTLVYGKTLAIND